VYYGLPDQMILAMGGLREGELLGPLQKHRVKVWVEQLREMGLKLPFEEPPIESYYMLRYPGSLPPHVELLLPRDLDESEKLKILGILLYMVQEDRRHTGYSDIPELAICTLDPILAVDRQVSEKVKEIGNIVKLELESVLHDIMFKLSELAIRYGVDIALFVYNFFSQELRRSKEYGVK